MHLDTTVHHIPSPVCWWDLSGGIVHDGVLVERLHGAEDSVGVARAEGSQCQRRVSEGRGETI